MLPDSKAPRFSPSSTVIVAALLGVLALHLTLVFRGTGLLRSQHLGTALLYANGSIDVMHPVIVGFNAAGTPTPLEFPLWQAATGALMKFFGPWWGWGNVVSLGARREAKRVSILTDHHTERVQHRGRIFAVPLLDRQPE